MKLPRSATILLQNFVFCTVIAFLLWQFVPSAGQFGFWSCFVHSQLIGSSICLMSIASSGLFSHFRIDSKPIRIFSLIIITVAGIYFGMWLAALLLDLPDEVNGYFTQPGNLLVSAITAILASLAFSWHLANRQKVLKLELAASEQGRRADQARHAMLQAQLEPHMLFNTLANLRALIGTDTDRALKMLDRLDSFLRETLQSSQTRFHTLEHEFSVLENYLALLNVRFGERLQYTLNLPAECKNQNIPSLLLQPLIENAVKHGIEPKMDGGTVSVLAACNDNNLTLKIIDTGVGFKSRQFTEINDGPGGPHGHHGRQGGVYSSSDRKGGFGLSNLQQRLQQTYDGKASLSVDYTYPSEQSGTTVIITLPLHLVETVA